MAFHLRSCPTSRSLPQIANDFLEFIADSVLIIHNASFDVGFLNAELAFQKLPSNSAGA